MAHCSAASCSAPALKNTSGADHERACPQLGQGCKRPYRNRVRCSLAEHGAAARGRGPPASASRNGLAIAGLVGLTSTAMIVAVGTSSCSSSSRFGPTSTFKLVMPVMLPPGRLRLATSPILTGSAPTAKTIGIVAVAALAASCRRSTAGRYNHVHLTVNQFGRKLWQSLVLVLPPSDIRSRRSGPRHSLFFQSLAECAQTDRVLVRRCAAEEPDHRHCRLAARAASGQSGPRTAEKHDELAPSHCPPRGFKSVSYRVTSRLEGVVVRMSALGHKRTFRYVHSCPLLPRKPTTISCRVPPCGL